MDNFIITLYIHGLVTWMLIGMTWFVQVIHYPLYDYIKKGFHEYEKMHLKRTGWLIGPLMFIEVITAIFLVGFAPPGAISKLAAINLILLVFVWISTFLFQVCEHQNLSIRFSKKIHHQLLRTNWARTIIWTIRGVVILLIFGVLLR